MKFFLLALISFYPFFQVKASTPKSVTCTRTEYREEYIPGTKSNPGYVRSYEVDVEIPCGGAKEEECTDGKIAGALLGFGGWRISCYFWKYWFRNINNFYFIFSKTF